MVRDYVYPIYSSVKRTVSTSKTLAYQKLIKTCFKCSLNKNKN